jgi:hypothetical protein
MKIIVAAVLLGSLLLGGLISGTAQAMPLAPVYDAAPEAIKVAGGCGPNMSRSPAGACKPVKGAVVVPGPVGPTPPRVCPVGQVLSRTGSCRPI